MGIRRFAALAAVAALTLPGGAATAARDAERALPPAEGHLRWRVDQGTVRPERDEIVRAVETLHETRSDDAARAVLSTSLRAAGFAGPLGPLDDGPVMFSEIVMVGDLDGDGRADAIELGTVFNDVTASTLLRARRGSDGKMLWEQKVPGWAAVRGARVGSAGAQGVLVFSYVQEWAGEGGVFAVAEAATLAAYSGTGTQVWSRQLGPDATAFGPLSGAWANVPVVYGVGDVLPGKADDLVLGSMALVAAPVAFETAAPAYVVNGADGTPGAAVGPDAYVSDSGSWVFLVPDLSGDGLADLVFEIGQWGATPVVVAQPGTGGQPVWTSTTLPISFMTYLYPAGDVTGDKRGDLTAYSDPSDGKDPDEVRVVVVSGSDGKVVGELPGEYAVGIGDVDRDGRRDLAVLSASFEKPRITLAVTAYSLNGRKHYRHVETFGPYGEDDYGYVDVWNVGDVHGDKVDDLGAQLASYHGTKRRTLDAVLDGRSGRRLHRSLGLSLRGSVDGRGDDLLVVSQPSKTTTRVVARDGATGRQLWSTDVTSAGAMYVSWGNADGDRCLDVAMSFYGNDGTVSTVLRGRDGRPAWGVRTTPDGEKPLSGLKAGKDANRGC